MSAAQVHKEERVNCDTTPTRADAERVLALVVNPSYRALLTLAALTGARIGECLALQVRSWDHARDELLITGRDPRRGKRGKVRLRRFPVLGRLRHVLEALTAERSHVPDAPLVPDLPPSATTIVTKLLRVACARAKVERFTPHGLRRMVALELLDATDPRTVAELTGHSVAILLQDYVRPQAQRLRDVVARAHDAPPPLRLVKHVSGTNAGTPPEDVGPDEVDT
jgi:integrase